MARCCCGRFKDMDDEDHAFIINETMHERLGLPGAFCGPIIKHDLRDTLDASKRKGEELDFVWKWIDRAARGEFDTGTCLNVLTHAPCAPEWVHRYKHESD